MTIQCKDCDKGHCDRWDHLIETVRSKQIHGRWTNYVVLPRPVTVCEGSIVSVEVIRAEPVNIEVIWMEPAEAVVGVGLEADKGDRCDCGGIFAPGPGGKVVCGCCGAPQHFEVPPVAEAGGSQTLNEYLLERRRKVAVVEREPTDDDVKVTTHA